MTAMTLVLTDDRLSVATYVLGVMPMTVDACSFYKSNNKMTSVKGRELKHTTDVKGGCPYGATTSSLLRIFPKRFYSEGVLIFWGEFFQ